MLTKSEYDRKNGTGTITENFKEGQLKSTYVLRNHKVQSETHYYQNGKLRESKSLSTPTSGRHSAQGIWKPTRLPIAVILF